MMSSDEYIRKPASVKATDTAVNRCESTGDEKRFYAKRRTFAPAFS